MSKTLFLIRHAMPEDGFAMPDIERRLTSGGLKDASEIGAQWKQEGFCPQLILTSAAVRAQQTATQIAKACDFPEAEIMVEKSLYSTDEFTLLHRLNELPDKVETAVLVNHNPAISGLLEYLTGEYTSMMRQGSVAKLEFKGVNAWQEVRGGTATLHALTHPTP